MAMVTLGTDVFGRLDRDDGTADATEFFHASYLPLIPLGGRRLRGVRSEPAPLRAASVALAYFRGWGWFGAIAALCGAFFAVTGEVRALGPALACGVGGLIALELYIGSWLVGRRRPWSGARRLATALLLTLPLAGAGVGMWVAAGEHPAMQERRCLAGNFDACYELGHRCEVGIDIPVDTARALELYDRSCAAGVRNACRRRAEMHPRRAPGLLR